MGHVSSQAAAALPAAAAAASVGTAASACASMDRKGVSAASQATAAPQGRSTSSARSKKQQSQLEAKLQWHMDREDQRVKELTEGVLYDFLPAALEAILPICEDPLQELNADRCRAVAAAALAVSSLMNAPPGFLEFLLCIPWQQLPQLYPIAGSSTGSAYSEQLLEHLAVDEQERLLLVNMPIHPELLQPVVQFMYRPGHADSVPPMLRPGSLLHKQRPEDSISLEFGGSCTACSAAGNELDTASALLDGATSLHCAAIRGNPASVHHLLHCGADPTLRTAAGYTALELVPVCGGISQQTGARQCKCLGPAEQEVWECRSRLACTLIAQRCLACFHIGVTQYLALLWLCLLAFLGILGGRVFQRSALQSHVQRRRLQQRQSVQARASALLSRMRQEFVLGRRYLCMAQQKPGLSEHNVEDLTQNSSSSSSTSHRIAGIRVQYENGSGQEPLAPATPSAAAEAAGDVAADAVHTLVHGCHDRDQMQQDHQVQTLMAVSNETKAGLHPGSREAQRLGRLKPHNEEIQHPHATVASQPEQSEHDQQDSSPKQTSFDSVGSAEAVESAFKCYVRAVHALQSLDLQGGILPKPLVASTCHGSESSGAEDGVASAATAAHPGCGVAGTATWTAAATPHHMVHAGNANQDTCSIVSTHSLQQHQQSPLAILEDEQAEVYCCWAESVLLKFKACSCPGCTALAVQAIRMAHIAVARLHDRMQQLQKQPLSRRQAVGHCLSRVVYSHIALLCGTEMRLSPSKAALWRAQHCLQEWDTLAAAGLLDPELLQPAASAADLSLVDALRLWARTAESDLIIAEGLLGSSLAPHNTLNEALAAALISQEIGASAPEASTSAGKSQQPNSSSSHLPVLVRPITAAVLDQLQVARGLATCPSAPVKQLAAQIADAAARELSAASKLKNVLAIGTAPSSDKGVAALADAIAAGTPFPSLVADVAAARVLYEQCCQRAEAANRLQVTIQKVVEQTSRVTAMTCSISVLGSGTSKQHTGCEVNGVMLPIQHYDPASWQDCVSVLEAAVEEAKSANVSVVKARRLMKELQAQMLAAEAAASLQCCLSKRPCGSAALKAAISKADTAAAAVSNAFGSSSSNSAVTGISSSTANGCSCAVVFTELLVHRLQAAKKRLEIERAVEALHRALVAHRSLADLAKLEAAILNARKVGAEELAPDDYKAASELRIRLATAAKVKQQLDVSLKCLTTTGPAHKEGQQSGQLTQQVEAAIEEAKCWEELLPGEAARAADMLEAWRASSAQEAKLTRALQEGSSSAQLSRLITEAAAAGVKVTSARKVLKLQQLLDQAMEAAASASTGSTAVFDLLTSRLEAAEQAGVAPGLLERARQLLTKLAASEAKEALEAALKPHTDWSADVRIAAIRAALDKAETVLEVRVQELAEQHQQLQPDSQQCSFHELLGTADPVVQQESAAGSPYQSAASAAKSASLQHAASTASSAAASETSITSALLVSSLLQLSKDSRCADNGHAEVTQVLTADVCQLALRAWEVLRRDQRLLDEINREKAEKEKVRKALKEQERQERMRVEAERAQRSKAEREKQAAERKQARARAAAGRSKQFAALWGGVGRPSVSEPADKASAGLLESQSAVDGSNPSVDSSLQSASPKPATACSFGSEADAGARCSHAAAADQQSQGQEPLLATATSKPQHVRSDSYDLLGDASSTLGHEVMALLDMHDHAAATSPPGRSQQQQKWPTGALSRRSSFDTSTSLQRRPHRVLSESSGEMHMHAGFSCWQSSLSGGVDPEQSPTVSSRSSSSNQPKFGVVDLGGASWGVDRADGSLSGLSHLSPTGPAAAGGRGGGMQQGGHVLCQTSAAVSRAGVWSPLTSSLEGGLQSQPPQLPKQERLLQHTGWPYSSSNNSPSSTSCPVVCDTASSMLPCSYSTQTRYAFEQQPRATDGLSRLPAPAYQQAMQDSMKTRSVSLAEGSGLGVQLGNHIPLLHAMTSVPQAWNNKSALGLQSHQVMAASQHTGMPAASMAMLADDPPLNMLGSLEVSTNQAQQHHQTHLLLLQQQQLSHTQQAKLHQQQLSQSAQHQMQLMAPKVASVGESGAPPSAGSMSNLGRYSSSFAFGAPHLYAFSSSTTDSPAAVSSYSAMQTSHVGSSQASGDGAAGSIMKAAAPDVPGPDLVDRLPDDLTFSPT